MLRTSPAKLEQMAALGRESVRKHHDTPTETARLADYLSESVADEQRRRGGS